ncbi:ABC transporter permease [Nesterenkonia ebinurensis]|uniref:ABC transporter permease n=1 Tax=Nesterenkonia ebinurensis TaxID=2608252 RepID=UPI00123DE224|nr:ABC transporter permease [Nesterenkonia ebinurensis]
MGNLIVNLQLLRKPAWLMVPAAILLAFAFLLPLLSVAQMAFREPSTIGITDGPYTVENLTQAVSDPFYWGVIRNTAVLALCVAVATTILAYPVALLITLSNPRIRNILLILSVSPMLMSSVAQTFGWVVILGPRGVVNTALSYFGVDHTIAFIGSMSGIVIALTEIFLPYAVLAMSSGFGRISPGLVAAARTLGANPVIAFFRVTLPLSMPGVLLSLFLVFVISISAYVTPQVMGGGRVFVLATQIYSHATITLNWPLAATLALLLLAMFGLFTALSVAARRRFSRRGVTQ